jgi:hypothetical protein
MQSLCRFVNHLCFFLCTFMHYSCRFYKSLCIINARFMQLNARIMQNIYRIHAEIMHVLCSFWNFNASILCLCSFHESFNAIFIQILYTFMYILCTFYSERMHFYILFMQFLCRFHASSRVFHAVFIQNLDQKPEIGKYACFMQKQMQ